MKGLFLAAAILISAPVYAVEKDFPDFLKDYQAFLAKRNVENQKHSAVFSGNFVFRQECSRFYVSDSGAGEACQCPEGNNYLQCLVSAKAVITADPNDIGGKGYVLVMSGGSILNQRGQWVPMTQRNTYTTTVERIGRTNVIDIPIPDAASIANACSSVKADEPITLTVGYGAAMPMDMEFARRMKVRSAEFGQAFDVEGHVFSRARLNGARPRKAGTIGQAFCRPVMQGSNSY